MRLEILGNPKLTEKEVGHWKAVDCSEGRRIAAEMECPLVEETLEHER